MREISNFRIKSKKTIIPMEIAKLSGNVKVFAYLLVTLARRLVVVVETNFLLL